MSILVTGGAGFIGGNFVLDWLAVSDEEIINHDALTYGPEDFFQINIVGAIRLFEAVRAYWNGLETNEKESFRYLHVSTDEVYGSLEKDDPAFAEPTVTNPTAPTQPARPPATTWCAPTTTPTACRYLPTNCSNHFGPFHFPEKLIPLYIHNSLAGKPLPINGDGQQIHDWLYVIDYCSAIRRVLEAGRVSELYNDGGWNEKPNLDTLCAIFDELSPRADCKPYEEQITYVQDRPGHDRRYAIDANKIERELGWKLAETFETGIEKAVQWFLDNQEWVQNVTSGAYKNWVGKQYGANK